MEVTVCHESGSEVVVVVDNLAETAGGLAETASRSLLHTLPAVAQLLHHGVKLDAETPLSSSSVQSGDILTLITTAPTRDRSAAAHLMKRCYYTDCHTAHYQALLRDALELDPNNVVALAHQTLAKHRTTLTLTDAILATIEDHPSAGDPLMWLWRGLYGDDEVCIGGETLRRREVLIRACSVDMDCIDAFREMWGAVAEGADVTLEDGSVWTKGDLLRHRVTIQPTLGSLYSLLLGTLEAGEVVVFKDGSEMTQTELLVRGLDCAETIPALHGLAATLPTGGSVVLRSCERVTKADLYTRSIKLAPWVAKSYRLLAGELEEGGHVMVGDKRWTKEALLQHAERG